jgi:hypothetical protein
VDWNDIKGNPPEQLKISPISMVPHKSRKFRTILDLSFAILLESGDDTRRSTRQQKNLLHRERSANWDTHWAI